ncbi:MAG: BMP family ABC transporter substrate-binding protein [Bacillota bacterium]
MSRRTLSLFLAAVMVFALVFDVAGAAAALKAKRYKVGLLVNLLGDRSYWDSAARGIKWANEKLPNIDGRVFEHKDTGEMELTARALADQGYDMVIVMGWGSEDWAARVAKEYPDTHFFGAAVKLPNLPNTSSGDFLEHEGCFTVGMVAAMMTKTGKVGYIGGSDSPLLNRFRLGYIQGVKYANPKVEVVTGWVGVFNDPTKAKELALTQYQEGCDIIFAAAGKSGEGVLAAAAEKGKYAIGVDSDQCWIRPGNVITSMLKRVDMVVFNKCKQLSEGALKTGFEAYGLKEGLVGACHLYGEDTEFLDKGPKDMVAKLKNEVMPQVQKAVERIKAGEFGVEDYMKVFPVTKTPPVGGMIK